MIKLKFIYKNHENSVNNINNLINAQNLFVKSNIK